MPTATEHAFDKAVAAGRFAPAYYLFGDDDFRKDEAVAAALDAIVAPELRDFNIDVGRGPDLDAESLVTMLATPPLAAPRRGVAVRDVSALKKDARRALDQYLERPAADTILLLVAPAGARPDAVLAARTTTVEFPALDGDRLPAWLAHRAKKLGATITPGASALLQAAAGPDLATLASELDKLVSYARGAVGDAAPPASPRTPLCVDEDAVAAVVGVRRGETMADLLDRVAERDATGALALVESVLAQPKTSAVAIVMGLATQTLALAWGRARRDEGLNAARLGSELFSLLKATAANPMRPWAEAVETWARTADRWTLADLDRALVALAATDAALKETRLTSDEQAIATLVLAMCAGAQAPAGAPEGRVPAGVAA